MVIPPRAYIASLLDGLQQTGSGYVSGVSGVFVGTIAGGATTLTVGGVPFAPAAAVMTGAATGHFVDKGLDYVWDKHFREPAINGTVAAYEFVNDLFD